MASSLLKFDCLLAALLLGGCAGSSRDRPWAVREAAVRSGLPAASTDASADSSPPLRVLDEATVTAQVLERSPTLQSELSRIDSARATLSEARRPANPQISLFAPFGLITAVATVMQPVESLWQMPQRTRAAAFEADAAGEAVLMRALDLVRDARLLHVELGLAQDRSTILSELEAVATDTARIAEVRMRLGDISPLDANVLKADAQTAVDTSDTARTTFALARARLAAALATDANVLAPLEIHFKRMRPVLPPVEDMLAIARKVRPDAVASEAAFAGAVSRVGWERGRVVSAAVVAERQWSQNAGEGSRLGGRIDLPLFGFNPGGIGRAHAEVARTGAQQEFVARTIVLEVISARARLEQAVRSSERFEKTVLPALHEALEIAKRSFESGDDSYLVVLDVLRRSGEARLRHAELAAEQRRAVCELERAVGAHLESLPLPTPSARTP